jgi:hypothetical protein
MLPHEIQAAIAGNSKLTAGYNNMLSWIAQGGKHGSYAGLIPNEAVVREEMTPWGENVHYDAAGNQVSYYRQPRPGEVSPYQGPAGPSAPEYDPARSAAAFVPEAFKAKNIPSLAGALGQTASQPTQAPVSPSLLAALAGDQETEQERQARLLKAAGYGASLAS